MQFVFIVCPSRGLPKYIKIKLQTTCFDSILALKAKTGLELVSLPYFLHGF